MAGLLTLALAPRSSAAPKPTPRTPAQVQKELAALAVRNTALVEQFDQARIVVQRRLREARADHRAAVRAEAAYRRSQPAYTRVLQYQYEQGGSFDSVGLLLSSTDPSSYLRAAQIQTMMSSHLSKVVTDYRHDRQLALVAAKQASAALQTARATQQALATRRADLSTRITRYKRLLASLTAAQRARYQRSQVHAVKVPTVRVSRSGASGVRPNLPAATSAAAAQAVKFALAQVGKWYQFGASGPDTYDCSGLTMAAWASAGVSLPHSAAEQYNYGTHVPPDVADLQPGDLIFFYTPIGHVTIYIGNGLMVSAPETGERVSVIPLHGTNAPIVGATRLTG